MSIINTLSEINSLGLANQSRFKVQIIIPISAITNSVFTLFEFATENVIDRTRLNLSVENADTPGKSIATSDVRHYGPTRKVPYTVNYEDVSMIMRISEDFNERKIIEAWMSAVIDSVTNDANYLSEYAGSVIIEQFDKNDNKIYGITLNDAFPIALGALDNDHAAANAYHKQSVTFAFLKYKIHDFRDDLLNGFNLPNISEIPDIYDIINFGADSNAGTAVLNNIATRAQSIKDSILNPINSLRSSSLDFFNF